MADYMIIASGTSSRHIQSLSEQVLDELKNNGVFNSKIEGKRKWRMETSRWNRFDYSYFSSRKRKFYELEKIWSELIPKEKLII